MHYHHQHWQPQECHSFHCTCVVALGDCVSVLCFATLCYATLCYAPVFQRRAGLCIMLVGRVLGGRLARVQWGVEGFGLGCIGCEGVESCAESWACFCLTLHPSNTTVSQAISIYLSIDLYVCAGPGPPSIHKMPRALSSCYEATRDDSDVNRISCGWLLACLLG